MSINKVRSYFSKYGLDTKIQEFDVSSATVELAAHALGCEAKRIAKTIAFQLKNPNKSVLIVAAGDAKINNGKYKAVFGEKAVMMPPNATVDIIGHAVGGMCPFAIHQGVNVFLDISLQRFETVFPACGSNNSVIELTIQELEQHSGFDAWVDVCKGWQTEHPE